MTTVENGWTIEDAKDLYNLRGWGVGYFGVNEAGHLVVHPTREPRRSIDLYEVARGAVLGHVGLVVQLGR